jgi:sulfoxide reductase catalytic subunit YedY
MGRDQMLAEEMSRLSKMSRRRFVRLVLGGLAVSVLDNCAPGALPPAATPTPQALRAATSIPTSTPLPEATQPATPMPHLPLLRNDNVPGFYVRYYKPFPAVAAEQWTLDVGGLVRSPQTLSLPDVLALPRVSQVSRLKCVECWSAAAGWEGFHLSALLELVDPHPEAEWLQIHCADGYYESLNMVQLLADRVLFAHHMNDQRLPDIYGAPLRLVVPYLYGYKNAKAIVRLEFTREESRGYWSTVGLYDPIGNIRPGRDHPLDLEGSREIPGGVEIFYPDGIEWQDREGA